MAAAQPKSPPIKHSLTLDIEIPADFVADMVHGRSTFTQTQSSYWAAGVRCHDNAGWLVYEHAEHGTPAESAIARAKLHYRDGKPLPTGWHLLNEEAAIRAWCEGVKRWGVRWYDNADGPRYDMVLQLSLFGELRYA